MERIGVRELNQHTSAVLDRVRHGESLEVTDHGRPVARLVPIASAQSAVDRLIADGTLIAPTLAGPMPSPPVIGDPGVSAAAELIALRDEERW